MKCENCGKNEVTFVCRSEINGRVTQRHLCGACAEALGLTADFGSVLFRDVFRGGWPETAGLERLFARSAGLLTEEDAAPQFVRQMPAEREEELLDAAECRRIREQRQRNALERALQEAVRREDYEGAARLRDELRELEGRKESA